MTKNLISTAVVTLVAASCAICTPVMDRPQQKEISETLARVPSRRPSAETFQKACAPCADGAHYKVHLTFDDGPYKTLTQKILAVLKEKGPIEATFFELMSAYSSRRSEKAMSNFDDATPAQLQAILSGVESGGHGLACHTLEHIDHLASEILLSKAKSNIKRGIALSPPGSIKYLRLPYGRGWYKEKSGSDDERRATAIMNYIHELGYKHLGWDIDSFDWSSSYHHNQPSALLADICSQHGGIILMHDIQPFEARTLGNTIDSIRCSGHEIVSLKAMEDLNQQHSMTSFKDSADYQIVDCPGGLKEIRDGKCLVKPR